jgi:hypothetical protein
MRAMPVGLPSRAVTRQPHPGRFEGQVAQAAAQVEDVAFQVRQGQALEGVEGEIATIKLAPELGFEEADGMGGHDSVVRQTWGIPLPHAWGRLGGGGYPKHEGENQRTFSPPPPSLRGG